MLTNREIVLMAFLQCGTLDFSVLDDIEYDLEEIIEDLIANGIRPSLNYITSEVFHKGATELGEYVNARICALEAIPNERPLDEDEEIELAELQKLSAEDDVEWYCNCIDTSVWFAKNGDIYRKYLPVAVEAVEGNMGFNFGG